MIMVHEKDKIASYSTGKKYKACECCRKDISKSTRRGIELCPGCSYYVQRLKQQIRNLRYRNNQLLNNRSIK